MPDELDQATVDGLLAMVGDDPGFVDELVDAYVVDAPRLLADIRVAIDGDVTADVVRPAHTLKGSSATIGAVEAEALCRTIEERGRNDDSEGLAALADDLEGALDRLIDALAAARSRRWTAPS